MGGGSWEALLAGPSSVTGCAWSHGWILGCSGGSFRRDVLEFCLRIEN
jgi:hypothetical protein